MIESWRCSIANHASAPRPHHHISRFRPKTSILVPIVIFSNQSDLLQPHVCGLLQNIFQLFSMRTFLVLTYSFFGAAGANMYKRCQTSKQIDFPQIVSHLFLLGNCWPENSPVNGKVNRAKMKKKYFVLSKTFSYVQKMCEPKSF